MKYIIEKSQNTPAYLQLYKQVRDDIVKGIFSYNSKLPSKRTIAEEVGLSTVTVEHSYGLLIEEGYIEARERSGYFVIFRTDDGFVASSKGEDRHIFPLSHHEETKAEFPFSVLVHLICS